MGSNKLYRTMVNDSAHRTQQSPALLHVAHAELGVLAGQLRHRLTLLSDSRRSGSCRSAGLTIWSTPSRSATIYWDWVIQQDGCPVLADPLTIRSNVIVRAHGQAVSLDEQLLGINKLVSLLPWQAEVERHLDRLGLPARARPAVAMAA